MKWNYHQMVVYAVVYTCATWYAALCARKYVAALTHTAHLPQRFMLDLIKNEKREWIIKNSLTAEIQLNMLITTTSHIRCRSSSCRFSSWCEMNVPHSHYAANCVIAFCIQYIYSISGAELLCVEQMCNLMPTAHSWNRNGCCSAAAARD